MTEPEPTPVTEGGDVIGIAPNPPQDEPVEDRSKTPPPFQVQFLPPPPVLSSDE